MTVFQDVLKVWANAKAGVKTLASDDSGQAALVIITLVIVAAGVAISQMSVLNNRRNLEVAQEQRANFERITDAINSYAIQDLGNSSNDYLLPCPADPVADDGMAGTYTATACDTHRGIVPWADLGLSEQDVIDSNGNYLSYIVQEADVAACDGTDAASDTLVDNNGGATYAYALISHGNNGAGAYNSSSNTEVNPGAASANAEVDNCTSGTCTGTDNQFRSGPQNDTAGNEFFDDIVRAVSLSDFFTEECTELNSGGIETVLNLNGSPVQSLYSPPADSSAFNGVEGATLGDATDVAGGDNGTSDLQALRGFERTANSNPLNQPIVDFIDPDGVGGTGDETVAVRYVNGDAFASAACFLSESTFPLPGHTIRMYAQVYFEEDAAGDQGIGNGLVFGFMGHKIAAGSDEGDPVFVDTSTCGGVDSANGFASDGTFSFDSDIERFGLEIDTYDHRPDPGPPTTATDIYDPDFNHVAIVLGNVNHEDADAHAAGEGNGIGTGEGDDGPVCRSATTTDGDASSFGIAMEDRGGVAGAGNYSDDKSVVTTAPQMLDEVEGCLFNETDANWLENGDPFANTVATAQPSDVRIELHGESTNGCPAGEYLFSAWIYEDGEECGSCNNLLEDFTDDSPHVSMCIDDNDINAAADDELEDLAAVRLFVSNGFAASGAGIGGDATLTRLVMLAERIDGASKVEAADTAMTIDVTEDTLRDYFYNDVTLPTGNITLDQSYLRINQANGTKTDLFNDNFDDNFATGISLFSRQGSLSLDFRDGIGVSGVGNSATLLDTIDPSTGGDFIDFGEYLNVRDRERISIQFDELYRRFTVNLRNFGAVNNGQYAGTETENILIRAFNGETQVGGDLNVDVCVENEGTTNNDASMTVNHDFGGVFDLVQIIPVPAEASDLDGHTRVLVGAMKACGADMPCGFNPQGNDGDEGVGDDEFNDPIVNSTEAECHQIDPWPVTTTGLGTSEDIHPENALLYIGSSDNSNINIHRTWADFNDYDADEGGASAGDASAMDVNIMSQAGNIRLEDNGNSAIAAFGVDGAFGASQYIDSAASGNEEELRFRFNEDWSRLFIRIGRFNDLGSDDLEQAVITLYNDDAIVGAAYEIDACISGSTSDDWRKEVSIEATGLFDEVRISADPSTVSSTSSTISVNAVKACDLASSADCDGVTYGDSSTSTNLCTESFTP